MWLGGLVSVVYPCECRLPLWVSFTLVSVVYPCECRLPLWVSFTLVSVIYPCECRLPLWVSFTLVSVVYPCEFRLPLWVYIMGYKLAYTTGLLYAWSSSMQWGVWVWTVWHWVVLVHLICCSKGGWVLFLKNQRYHSGEVLSCSHSQVTESSRNSLLSL